MPYTDPWDGTDPPGTTLANKIDDKMRLIRAQLKERLESVLIVSITADPWVLKAPASGAVTAKKMIVPAWGFSGGTEQADGSKLWTAGDAATRCPLVLPNGTRIVLVRWLVKLSAVPGACTFKLMSQFFGAGSVTPSQDNSQAKSTAGQELIASSVLNIVVDSTARWYWLEADQVSTGTFQIYACEISYNTPDSRNTI